MALITCPECGEGISDDVQVCPKCGHISKGSEEKTDLTVGAETTESVLATTPAPKQRKKIIPIIIAAIVVIAVAITVPVAVSANKHKAENDARNSYIDSLSSLRTTALSGAANAESLCNLTHDVWYNTIYKTRDSTTDAYTISPSTKGFYSDFNTAIQNLYADQNTINEIAAIKSNQSAVDTIMKSLQNPTDEFKTCYGTADALYTAYEGLTGLAISPSGSLSTFTGNINQYDSDFMTYYNKLNLQIPDKDS